MGVDTHRRNFLRYLAASPLYGAASALADGEVGEPIAVPGDAIDIFDLKATAKANVPLAHYAYMATGVNNDRMLRANREAFDHFVTRSRRLINRSTVCPGWA